METIRLEDHEGVRILTLNRPEKKNAFNLRMSADLARAVRAADADDAVRVLVVTGAGADFSAGADMALFAGNPDAVPADELFEPGRIHELFFEFGKPAIAAVNGRAIGMGVTMLPAFDMVYAGARATFTTPFVRLGLVAELGSSFTLPRLIGRQRTNELMLRAKPIDAETAAAWGLVTRVFPDGVLLDEVMRIARDIAECPPKTLGKCKALLRSGELATDRGAQLEREREVLASCYGSEENVQAAMAFLQRRRG
jgi:2-(1,2-epoxy-1,2-dihydrophenyl)acetyl-CoA isomerase